ncbi:hypothetical protein G6F56_013872 [Rhizopus delemar]|nr:hypothetical protein G6F56_013872 [Rhizopus delemar]
MINYNTNFVVELILYVIRILAAVFFRDSFSLTDIEAVREILDEDSVLPILNNQNPDAYGRRDIPRLMKQAKVQFADKKRTIIELPHSKLDSWSWSNF